MTFFFITLLPLVSFANAQFQTFLSRPDILGAVQVQIIKPAVDSPQLAPGYWFLSPYLSDFTAASYGPQIIDGEGQLVWYGNASITRRAMDLHVCDYKNANIGNHLCLHDATPIQQGGHSSGQIRFFDDTYTQVDSFNGSGSLIPPDIHELNTPNSLGGNTFIQDVYQTVPTDLSAYSGPTDGFALSGCFQEVSFDSREVVFQWCSLDHVPLEETYLFIPQAEGREHSPITGDGSAQKPWDYFHINAIGKNIEGDYLVSSRHTNTIFKIAGMHSTTGHAPGDIVWRLGGKQNDFDMLGGFNFSWQHTVRFHGTTADRTELTLFDNASNGKLRSANTSSGMWISVNNASMTAELTRQYLPPTQLSSSSQGQLQKLPNDNVVIGWGSLPYFSEYTIDGSLLFHAHFGAAGADYMQSFRAWKYPWHGFPTEAPALFLYSRHCGGEATAYASWNGATEATTWRIHGSTASGDGPFDVLPDAGRSGFETSSTAGNGTRFAFVEALDASGNVLGRSPTVATFVPSEAVASNCTTTACGAGFIYTMANAQNCSSADPETSSGGSDGGSKDSGQEDEECSSDPSTPGLYSAAVYHDAAIAVGTGYDDHDVQVDSEDDGNSKAENIR